MRLLFWKRSVKFWKLWRRKLQRLFSAFPGGRHGFGLLLLRMTLGITAIIYGATYLSEKFQPTIFVRLAGISMIVCGVFLLIGFLTPIIGVLLLSGGSILAAFSLSNSLQILIYEIILSAAVALLGPGAYSIDARLFGRREIIIRKI